MRQVFSSARPENAEAVARLLEAEGIEVRIENGRTFRSSIRGSFSYREQPDAGPRAAVWVVRSDDQPRARQLLREAGLLEATAANPGNFLPNVGHAARLSADSPTRRARLRLILLVAAVIALALWLNQFRNPGWDLPAPAAAPAAPVVLDPSLLPVVTDTGTAHRIPVPPALAATLAARERDAAPGAALCLSVDGEDPGEAVLAAARDTGVEPLPASACPADGDALRVAVSDYRTDGSGTGTVSVSAIRGDGAPQVRELEVQRDEDTWRVLPAP
ncbi:putative signal transducing protein [Luteimonas kalidii]|uniref:DUF2007 domain-containing protein n=1 Tax=Luteimonas kalidii TaxID=3042025 RepID=A0ABT6JQM7_9GAMM|nr:DUF2007 domain-containing protein [Luteimonas kalidii]MDH5832975.1 DUF2007 domain-containing protein [Luteimonas kalidii]